MIPTETHSRIQAPRIASPVKITSASLLNLPLLLLISSVLLFGLCFYFLFAWPVFLLSLPCAGSLPPCPDVLLDVVSRQLKRRVQTVWCLCWFSSIWCLRLQNVAAREEERGVGASLPRWVQAFLSSRGADPPAVSAFTQAGLWAVQQPLWAQRSPVGTIALWTNPFSYKSIWEGQTKIQVMLRLCQGLTCRMGLQKCVMDVSII